MAPVLQLYGLSPEEGRQLTDQQADALYQSAYQAYLDTAGTVALRGSDPRAAFTNEISVSSAKLRDTLRTRLDAVLQSELGTRLRP